jgi:predicted nucleotidyltransferase
MNGERINVVTTPQCQAAQVIRDILRRHNIRVEQILLFGSRARGEAHPDSDWDFYVLLDCELEFPQKRRLVTEIQRELARLRIPNDVILASAERFRRLKDFPGHLGYTVAREGVPIP